MSASLEDYLAWREQQVPPIPVRCDNPKCRFHTEPLIWNDKPLIPVVHHIDGDEFDNRPHNICLLCRNCDSQKRITAG